MSTCDICTEPFNKSTRNKIACEYCNFEACSSCCRKWILDSSTVKCMNNSCDRTWTRKFISLHFPKSFINNELKVHREDILLQQETALLPETQPYVEEEIRKETINNEISNLRREQLNIEHRISNLRTDLYRHARTVTERREFVRECPDEECRGFLSTAWKCGICEKWTCPECHEVKGTNRDSEHTCNPDSVATAQLLNRDTKPCPKCRTGIFKIDGCFAENTEILLQDGTIKMSQDIQVGDELVGDDGDLRTVLNTFSGIDELYQVNQTKSINYVVNSKHILVLIKDDEIVEIMVSDYMKLSITEKDELIGFKVINSKSTNKQNIIKTPIYVENIKKGRYYGWEVDSNHRFILSDFTVVRNCNQMWCTQCHTGFNWVTGRIETNVHNPHFFEWQRRNAVNGDIPRTPNEEPVNCQVITHETSRHFLNMIRLYPNASEESKSIYSKMVSTIVRNIVHIRAVEIPRYEVNYTGHNRILRIQYMRNKITQADFKMMIQRNNKRFDKNTEIRNVYDLLLNTVTDIILRVYNNLRTERLQFDTTVTITSFELLFEPFEEIHPIVEYVNECFKEIGHTYSSRAIQYDDELIYI